MARTYGRDEVQAILARALEGTHGQEGDQLSYDDLVSIGRELGIPEASIEVAANSLGDELVIKRAVEERVRAGRRGFVGHLIPYVLVHVLLASINLTFGGPYWFLWSMFGWGIAIALHGWSALFPDRAKIEMKARKRLEREREREAAKRRKEERLGQAGKRLESAVQNVVAAGLDAVAGAIEDSRDRSRRVRPPSGGARVRVARDTAPRGQARVAPGEPDYAYEDDERERARGRTR